MTLNSCQLSYCQVLEHFIIAEADLDYEVVSPTSRQPLTATDQFSAPMVSFVRTHHRSATIHCASFYVLTFAQHHMVKVHLL